MSSFGGGEHGLFTDDPGMVNGFGDYNDSSTTTTALVLAANTWTDVPNDGLGGFTNLLYLPNGVTKLMDTTTGKFDFTELKLGSTAHIRNDVIVTPDTNNALLEMRYVIGIGGNQYTLENIIGRLDSGSGNPYRFALQADLIYMGDANTRDNPLTLQVRLSGSGELINNGSAISVNVH